MHVTHGLPVCGLPARGRPARGHPTQLDLIGGGSSDALCNDIRSVVRRLSREELTSDLGPVQLE